NRLPCPHFNIKIVQRSKGQSVVAAAAYQSGDRLFCEYDQKTKHYRNKKEVVFSTILTPPHAPPELTDRNTLWNSVEKAETRYNSQLARRVVMALPKEIPREQQIQLVQEYCKAQFVSKGMIADIAVHDKGDGNPHAHILLTMRPVDEKRNWAPKGRMVYDLDEHGQKQKTAKGNWKCHKEPTVDWNDRKYAEIWRHEWEGIVNRYYAENGLEERVDLRSYSRQGIDKVPTVHMGPAVTQMEKRGVCTNLGDLNQEIRAFNAYRCCLTRSIRTISAQLEELNRRREDVAIQAFPFDHPRDLMDLLWVYHDIRSDERKSWSRYAQRKANIRDLQTMIDCYTWLKKNDIWEISDFNARFAQLREEVKAVTDDIDAMEKERCSLETWHKHLTNRKKYRPIFEQYAGKVFKANKERFAEEHKEELDKYRAAVRYFKAHPDKAGTSATDLIKRHNELKTPIAAENDKLTDLKSQMELFGRISYYISQIYKPRPNLEEQSDRTEAKKSEILAPEPPKKRRRSDPSL
ncbi:MAG: MobQ family relaxase, partial [Eubacteriales bacterium]|nr:MobQ family relaxase [Eubacteriales bacterium]